MCREGEDLGVQHLSQRDRIDVVQQDKDVLDETLQSNQETFTSISDGGKDSRRIVVLNEWAA